LEIAVAAHLVKNAHLGRIRKTQCDQLRNEISNLFLLLFLTKYCIIYTRTAEHSRAECSMPSSSDVDPKDIYINTLMLAAA